MACLPLLTASCGGGALGQSQLLESPDADSFGLPGPIAVGAAITPTIALDIKGSGTLSMRMVSMRPDVLHADDHRLTGRAPGVAAVVIAADDGSVLDFIHLWVTRATHLALYRLDTDRRRRSEIDDTVELMVGERMFVTPVIHAGNQVLSGHADTEWHVDRSVARLLRDGDRQRRRLVAHAPGRTTVTVAALGLESSFELVVVP